MSETKFCFSKKTSVAAWARMFISIWSTEERIPATSLIGRSEWSATASRLVEIWCMRQMPATPTSNATAIATAKPATMRVLTLRARIAASTRGSCKEGSRIPSTIDRDPGVPEPDREALVMQALSCRCSGS